MRLPTIMILAGAAILALQIAWVFNFGWPEPRFGNFAKLLIFAATILIAGLFWQIWNWRVGEDEVPLTANVFDIRSRTTQSAAEQTRQVIVRIDDEDRRKHAALLAQLRTGPEVRVGEVSYDADHLLCMRPSNMLISLTRFAWEFPNYKQLADEIYLARTGSERNEDELAALEREREYWTRNLAEDENLKRAVRRLAQAGVTTELGGQGDYCGEFVVLRCRSYREYLPALEQIAAEDAGIPESEREEAARLFEIWMKQNYARDYKKHREELPLVEASPYDIAL